MNDSLKKFQRLLRELFQFDCADLDFGIYRIMNYKRDVVKKFITQDLPKAVAQELDRGALADQSQAAKELKEVAEQIRETLGKDALDAEGNLAETYHATPLGKKYLGLKQKAAGGRDREALQATIFSHLYTFFSRYYQDGDFISKRRYSKRQKYAIPYNGEEVYLYWANHDQYYIKTAEHFHDYTFSTHGVTVHFKLFQADVEQNNVRGDKRFFLLRVKEINWDEEAGQLVIPFDYRPLTEQEGITYGKKNQQEKIIEEALDEIPKQLSPKKAAQALAALTAERHKAADGRSVSFLEHHLRHYTRRNTSDFFIHKDLNGFLTRELDFYLKNEVLNLDEIEAAGEERAEAWFQLMRVIKAIGGRIIEFLAQIEDFQKMLWEKRKFITETQYCITVGTIDESFYAEIAECEANWNEWKELFCIGELENDMFSGNMETKEGRIAFLKAHPTLVLDTKHFDRNFVDRLLASFDDLDELTDGLLVHSENWQALNLLMEKYRDRVKCIYIDPPYNTGEDEFLYKDSYQHSSWLASIVDRVALARNLMQLDGLFFSSIDFVEEARLRELLDSLFGQENFLAKVIWEKRFTRSNNAKLFASLTEFILVYRRSGAIALLREPRSEKADSIYTNPDNDPRGPWTSVSYVNPASKEARPNLVYPIVNPFTGEKVIHPTNAWKYERAAYERHARENRLYWGVKGENKYPRLKRFLSEIQGMVPVDLWSHKDTGTTDAASKLLESEFGTKVFQFPKPPSLIRRIIRLAGFGENNGVFCDFFAGTGPLAHAVINLNREDGGQRKFILVEMGDYFDTVLLPRIKKVTFTPEWKDGRPKRMATHEEAERSPRIVKYIRLESYEDTLNNIEFDVVSGQRALFFDDYLLQYMLKWETRKSETLLNVEKLASPFSYKLHIHADLPAEVSAQAGGQTREKVVDIPETFNYLLGLHVKTRQVLHDGDRRYLVYRGRIDHREVVIIWRENKDWTKEDLERDKKFVADQKLTEVADEVFVNGDSFIRGAKALEPVFKARMFASVE